MKYLISQKAGAIMLVLALIISGCQPLQQPPTVTPSPTPTQQIIATATQSISAEPAPLPEPRFADADIALSFGDYEKALALYSGSPPSNTDEFRAVALYGQGLTQFKQKDYFHARQTLDELTNAFPDSLPAIRANYLLGLIDLEQDLPVSALADFQSYLKSRPGILDADVYEKVGDLYAQQGDQQKALEAYSKAYLSPYDGENTGAALKVADMYSQTDQPDLAMGIYQEIYYNTKNEYLRAQTDLLMGRLLIAKGDLEGGYAYYQDAVNNYPLAYDSYSALTALVDADQPVDEIQRGLINYYVGQFDLAVEAFDRYLSGDGNLKDKALYFKALSVRAQGLGKASLGSTERFDFNAQGGMQQDKEAISLWSELIRDYVTSTYRVDAMEDIIYTQNTYMGQISLAIKTALVFVADAPSASYASTLLWTAGRYYTLDNKPLEAAQTWTQIGIEHPEADEAFEGLFFSGIIFFHLGNMDQAASNFNRAVLIASAPLETAGAYLWLGKISQQKGDLETANKMWETAQQTDPSGYYGIRSAELIANQPVFSEPARLNLDIDLIAERQTAAVWLRTAFNLSTQTDLDFSRELFNDQRMIRAIEYNKLGLYREASNEFESLRDEYASDPVNTFRLIQVFLDNGYYRSTIVAAQSLIKLAGYQDDPLSSNLPPYFAYLSYGDYYQSWVQSAAEQYNLPVLLLFSLIRQESHFEGHATSSAGANGLMQIMPETGAQIAAETGWPQNYSQDDLSVPFYSLGLGTNYLARQVQLFDGDLYAALAAYNGGPGNALTWKAAAGSDPDMFLGTVSYQETRNYIRNIVENYAMYSKIYRE